MFDEFEQTDFGESSSATSEHEEDRVFYFGNEYIKKRGIKTNYQNFEMLTREHVEMVLESVVNERLHYKGDLGIWGI